MEEKATKNFLPHWARKPDNPGFTGEEGAEIIEKFLLGQTKEEESLFRNLTDLRFPARHTRKYLNDVLQSLRNLDAQEAQKCSEAWASLCLKHGILAGLIGISHFAKADLSCHSYSGLKEHELRRCASVQKLVFSKQKNSLMGLIANPRNPTLYPMWIVRSAKDYGNRKNCAYFDAIVFPNGMFIPTFEQAGSEENAEKCRRLFESIGINPYNPISTVGKLEVSCTLYDPSIPNAVYDSVQTLSQNRQPEFKYRIMLNLFQPGNRQIRNIETYSPGYAFIVPFIKPLSGQRKIVETQSRGMHNPQQTFCSLAAQTVNICRRAMSLSQ